MFSLRRPVVQRIVHPCGPRQILRSIRASIAVIADEQFSPENTFGRGSLPAPRRGETTERAV